MQVQHTHVHVAKFNKHFLFYVVFFRNFYFGVRFQQNEKLPGWQTKIFLASFLLLTMYIVRVIPKTFLKLQHSLTHDDVRQR